ncbi:MAG: hypothetical protein ACRD2G_13150, partial [Terriglobia bacterium]
PYTLSVNANDKGPNRKSSLRTRLRVPIRTGANQFQYQDVGTDIDSSAESLEAGLFKISLGVQRSSLYPPLDVRFHGALHEFGRKLPEPGNASKPEIEGGSSTIALQPIFSTFSTSLNLVMRDGQTIESTMTTDPVSGRVLNVDVTLHVVKNQ